MNKLADGGVVQQHRAATVLIADDLPEIVDTYSALLADHHEVRQAYGGEEALARLDEDLDVVLLDRKMPDLSGYEIVDEIRARYGDDICIAILSASAPGFDIVDVDIDDYLTKPLDSQELNATVEHLAEKVEYDARRRTHDKIEAKIDALEANASLSMLEASDEYAKLKRRLQERERELDRSQG